MKRVLDKGRFTTGEGGQADYLAGWLNDAASGRLGKKQQEAQPRIIGLMELCERIRAEISNAGNCDLSVNTSVNLTFLLANLTKRFRDDYKPLMRFSIESGNQLRSTYITSESPSGTNGEGLAARAVLLLLQNGLLKQIRLCMCNKWFVARRADTRFCSAKCRHKHYEQTEEFKIKRRKYMQDYYRNWLSPKRFQCSKKQSANPAFRKSKGR